MTPLTAPHLLILADAGPEFATRSAGQMLLMVLVLAGLGKCWTISKRPTTNRKCVLALMSVLLIWLLGSGSIVVRGVLAGSPAATFVAMLVPLLTLGLVVGAISFGILGLREMSAQPGVYVQGRSQAIWALVLVGFVGLTVIFGIIRSATSSASLTSKPGSVKPGEAVTFPELNFRFSAPARPWVPFDAGKINRDAKLGFMRRAPEMYFLIAAESLGSSAGVTTTELANIGKVNLEALAKSSRVVKEAPLTLNGVNGLLVDAEATLGNLSVYYQNWYAATNGYTYQLMGYCRASEREKLPDEVRKLLSGFVLIDPFATPSGAGFKTNFISARFPYTVNVTNSDWGPFPALEKDFPAAEFGASQGYTCFGVVPLQLGSDKIDPEALTAGLLGTLEIAFPDENLTNRKIVSQANLEGVQYDFTRELEKTKYSYRLRVLQGGGNAFLIAAWTTRPQAQADAVLEECMDRVKFSAPAPPLVPGARELSASERKTQASVLNLAGLYLHKAGEYERAMPLFRSAFVCNPDERTYLENAFTAWSYLDRPTEALDFLRTQKPSVLEMPEVRAWQAWFQWEANLNDQAITNYASLFATGYRDERHFERYITALNLERQFDRALDEVNADLNKVDSLATRLLQADTYRQKGDLHKALASLQQLRQKSPFNSQVAVEIVNTSLQAELYKDALDIARDMTRNNRDSASWHFLKGKSELGLKWYREAKASFEAAAKLAPADKDISSYVEHVSGILGEGSNTMLKEAIDPVPLPASLTNAIAQAAAGYATNYGAYYPRHILAVSWEPGKERRTTTYSVVRVLDGAGVAAFSTFQRTFDPLGEQIFVNDLRVLDSSGKLISTGKVSDYYVLDQDSGNMGTHRKALNIPVAGLQPGCQIILTITRSELGSCEEFSFLGNSFSGSFPVQESIVFLCGDAARVKYEATGLKPEKLPEGVCWRAMDPLIVRFEPLQPSLETFTPMLWVTDASARWPDLAADYLGSINDRMATDPELQTLASNLVAGVQGADDKTAVLTRYVQTNLTYKAIEFGRRARIPNRPAEVFRNKYGDCKDHALLLQQMLVAAGIPAELALVSVHSLVQTNLPSLDQFDHMIVYAPLPGGAKFIDSTDKGSVASHSIPLGLAGREALILERGKPRFVTIPGYPADASSLEIQRRLCVTNNTDATVEETATFTGVHAAYLRGFLLGIPAASRAKMFQRQVGMDDREFSQFHLEALDQPGAPLRLRYSYFLKKQFHRSGERLSGLLYAPVERSYLSASSVEKRLTPFEITIPLTLRSTTEILLPDKCEAQNLAPLSPAIDPRFADCRAEWTAGKNLLKLEFRCRQSSGQFKPGDYSAYRDTLAHALSLIERDISLQVRD